MRRRHGEDRTVWLNNSVQGPKAVGCARTLVFHFVREDRGTIGVAGAEKLRRAESFARTSALTVPLAGTTVGNAAITVPVAALASVVEPFGLLAVALTSMVRPSSVCEQIGRAGADRGGEIVGRTVPGERQHIVALAGIRRRRQRLPLRRADNRRRRQGRQQCIEGNHSAGDCREGVAGRVRIELQ